MPTEISPAYRALWADPEIAARIDTDIDRVRKADIALRVVDADGKPIPGIKVSCEQISADFHFGANIFKLGGYPTPELNARYEQAFLNLFNAATVPFYWRDLEPRRGQTRFAADSPFIARRPPPDAVIPFCERHGLRMHGHYLVWDFFKWSAPDWLSRDPAQAEDNARQWEARIQEIAARYDGRIRRWDGLNESLCSIGPDGRPYAGSRSNTGASCTLPDGYDRLAFEWAAAAFSPGTRFDINEVSRCWGTEGSVNTTRYRDQVRRLLDEGAPVGGVGLQFHHISDESIRRIVAGERAHPRDLLNALDTLAPLGLPLHISEITLVSPGDDATDQDAQAEVARNFYRLWFSHPAVDSITWWNFPDGGAAPGEDHVRSGLLDADLAPKPAYHALRQLIHEEWRTRDTGETNAAGRHAFRGFQGDYRVSIQHGGKTTTHTLSAAKNTSAETVIRLAS